MKIAIIALALTAVVGMSVKQVEARPRHHHHHHHQARNHHHHHRGHVTRRAQLQPELILCDQRGCSDARTVARSVTTSVYHSGSSSSLVREARRYIGTNPTGRRSLWCGAFMDMVLRHTGHRGGGNLALAYSHYGTRVSSPTIGAIAVMRRRGGGHVGVVSGIDPNGNPIIVSGNHNHTVAEAVYPRSRISAYVLPNNNGS